ncbi:MAG TPA: penicillin-binding protein 2, partial [Nitratifractor sp.]|nr:penicillin-binding protein 2 [Nitratifractor sp.]
VSIHTKYLDPNKKEFFLKLFSIYSNIPLDDLKSKFYTKEGKAKKGWLVLADNIDAKEAIFLKELKYKLNRFKVFRGQGANKNFYYGLTISEKGENREYPLKEALSPILGYTRPYYSDGYKHIVGYNGIEKFYEKYLNHKQDGFISGKRDAVGYIIQNADTIYKRKHNGYSLVLNISLELQKNIDLILDTYKQKLGAKEVIAAVMRSSDSKVIALTSSNRYDPLDIQADQIANLQPKATSYAYEPGSVMKPIIYSLALEKGTITPETTFNTFNGKMWVGKYKITDDEPEPQLNAEDIIVKSSNIGISQIGWSLTNQEFREGLLRYGFGKQKSGIDIGNESTGNFYSLRKLRFKINRASNSYGYGMVATFSQLLKAYNVFNNGGVSVTPRVVNYIKNDQNKKFYLKKDFTKIAPVSANTAAIVKNTLLEVVKRGTGRAAQTEGLEIGGKTGTAMIVGKGGYEKRYHASFFGFVNDPEGNRYTIGVLVIEPDFKHHFASSSAVPVFKKIVDAMVERGLLKPNLNREQVEEIEQKRTLEEIKVKEVQQKQVKALKERLREQREAIIKEQKRTIEKRKLKKQIYKKRREKKGADTTRVKQFSPPPQTPDLF